MAKTIKKHWDMVLVGGIGLTLAIIGVLIMSGMIGMPSSVSAATTATATVDVSATVAESITLTIAGVPSGQTVVTGVTTTVTTNATSVAFGTVSDSANQIASHDLTVGTNAINGYTTNAKYNQALQINATTTITDWTGTNATPTNPFASPGTEAFGYTTNDTSLGTAPTNRFSTTTGGMWAKFETGDKEVTYDAAPQASQTTRIGYQIGVTADTEAGTYTDTITYTAVGSF